MSETKALLKKFYKLNVIDSNCRDIVSIYDKLCYLYEENNNRECRRIRKNAKAIIKEVNGGFYIDGIINTTICESKTYDFYNTEAGINLYIADCEKREKEYMLFFEEYNQNP